MDGNHIEGCQYEQRLERLEVIYPLAVQVVANHIAGAVKELQQVPAESVVDVEESAQDVLEGVAGGETMGVTGLSALRTIIAYIHFATVLAGRNFQQGRGFGLSSSYQFDLYGPIDAFHLAELEWLVFRRALYKRKKVQVFQYLPVRICLQFLTGGHSVQYSDEIHLGIEGGLCIDRTVADVECLFPVSAEFLQGFEDALRVGLHRFHVLASDDDIEEILREMLVYHLLDAITELGGDDSYLGSLSLELMEYGFRFGKQDGVHVHVLVRFLDVFFPVGGEGFRIVDAGEDGKRFFQCLADGALDLLVGDAGVSVAFEYVAEADDDAS